MVPDACRLNNHKVNSCSGQGCNLMEYYLAGDGFLRWHFYRNVECQNGVLVEDFTIDPATSYGLEDYPVMFDNNGDFDGVVVVDDNAPAFHTIAATIVLNGLEEDGLDVLNVMKLDSEVVTDYEQNMILIGDVCEMESMQDVLGYTSQNCNDFYTDHSVTNSYDEPYIGLYESSNSQHFYLVIAGRSDSVWLGAHVVERHSHPDFVGQSMVFAPNDPCIFDHAYQVEDVYDQVSDLWWELDTFSEDYLEPNNYPQLTSFENAQDDLTWFENRLHELMFDMVFGDYYVATDELEDTLLDLEDSLDEIEEELDDAGPYGYVDVGEVLDLIDLVNDIRYDIDQLENVTLC